MEKKIVELRKKLVGKTRRALQKKFAGPESHVIRATSLLHDLDSCFNLLAEHCIEWYGMHFPELSGIVKDNKVLLKLVYFVGSRNSFSEKSVKGLAPEKKAKEIVQAAKNSLGSNIGENALNEIRVLALNALNIKEEREMLLGFIEKEIKAIAPNFSRVAGSLLAARLLAEAGSLKRLALMPAGTIQTLGAEKALFRHLRGKGKPPKHGLILMHPFVQKVSRKNRGKMARALAGKLSIAAKADFFGKKDVSEKLLHGLEQRLGQLRQ